jgi:hypothetical protein
MPTTPNPRTAQQSKDYFTRMTAKVESRMDGAAGRIAETLKPVVTSGDAENMTKAQWYDMIRQNWGDPNWRAKQAFRMGPVKFVQDALEAHNLPKSLLKDNVQSITLGLSQYETPADSVPNDTLADSTAQPAPTDTPSPTPPQPAPTQTPTPAQ